MLADVPEGDSEGGVRLQCQESSQEHVGAEAGVSPLQDRGNHCR